MSPKRVLVCTGEASGDAVGGLLVSEMRRLGFDGEVFAVGSRKLEAAGAELIANSSTWGALGVYQAVKMAPKLIAGGRYVRSWLKKNPVDLFIPIDFGFLNIRLCRVAKQNGTKVFYFMPPGSWRRDRQGGDLAELTDKIATPFPWSAEMLLKSGANVVWVGHPVLQMAGADTGEPRDRMAIMPGSRAHEIELNLPVFAQAFCKLQTKLRPTIVAAPGANERRLSELWARNCSADVEISKEGSFGLLRQSRAAIICSGTASLEAAVCRTPSVVAYVLDSLMVLEAKVIRLKVKYIALPNIILDRLAVPELYYPNAIPDRIAEETQRLLDDGPQRTAQLSAFAELRELLGPQDAVTRAARIALSMLE